MAGERVQLEIASSTIIKTILLILLFVFLYILKDVVIIFLFALVIASGISPFANWLDEQGLPRVVGVLALYMIVLGLAVFVLSLVVPYISDDINRLISVLPKVVESVSSSLSILPNNLHPSIWIFWGKSKTFFQFFLISSTSLAIRGWFNCQCFWWLVFFRGNFDHLILSLGNA